VTPAHPFWSPEDQAWVRADSLAVGRSVLGWLGAADARILALTEVRTRRVDAMPVFNLTVEGEHDYFAEGILVHNKSPVECGGEVEVCGDGLDNDCDGLIDDFDEECPAEDTGETADTGASTPG
jgi:hypothetical protein